MATPTAIDTTQLDKSVDKAIEVVRTWNPPPANPDEAAATLLLRWIEAGTDGQGIVQAVLTDYITRRVKQRARSATKSK